MAVVNHKCLEINDKSWVMSRVVNRFTNRYWHTAIRLFLDAMRRTEPTFAEPKERNRNERRSPEAVVVQIILIQIAMEAKAVYNEEVMVTNEDAIAELGNELIGSREALTVGD